MDTLRSELGTVFTLCVFQRGSLIGWVPRLMQPALGGRYSSDRMGGSLGSSYRSFLQVSLLLEPPADIVTYLQ